MEFFLHRFNPSRICHAFLDVFRFSSTHVDDLLPNDVQRDIVDRKCAYLTNQHDVTTSPPGLVPGSQQAATRNRGKAILNSPQPIYDQEPSTVAEDDETSKDKEIDKLMALVSLSFKKIYKPTNNNLRTSSNTSHINQDNSPRINRSVGYENQRNGNVDGARETVGSSVVQKSRIQCYNCKEFKHVVRECQKPKKAKDAAYHREKMLLCKQEEAGMQLNAEQADWRDDTDDDELEDQELEAHYMYMAQLQEVSPDAANSGPIFDDEPLEEIDQNDDDNDLAKERELLASLIEKLKCEIDESKNRNKFLETSNKVLIEKLKGILHQTSIARTLEQNGVVERQNRTLVEAARTMLSAAKVPIFFWAEAI
nr:putative ribonuclease H-like domain-containing protein [Tanacetum cinerariifolium]